MVLLYSHTTSARLAYIANFIFKELLQTNYTITIDSEEFNNYDGVKINYSNHKLPGKVFHVANVSLLFEDNIIEQELDCFIIHDQKAFFKTDGDDFGFDIFAASFYLVSRYEEYLPHTKDMYGRYAHKNSLAFKEDFLHLPIINIWVKQLLASLIEKFQSAEFHTSTFEFVPTYDIDMAYSYKHKGLWRNIGGFFKAPSLERIMVLGQLKKDPFDSYEWLNDLHKENRLNPIYFFLVAEKNNKYDKNILPQKNIMWSLVKHHSKLYQIGLHPSWQSNTQKSLIQKEKQWLSEMAGGKKITNSRQHFIRMDLPATYQSLIEAEILDDYSMGYGTINGFRASVASSFYWFNFEKNEETNLRVHPFCFMDANCYYEQKQIPEAGLEELMRYYKICKEVDGTLITIFHNNFLGTAKQFKGWKAVYKEFIGIINKSV